MMQSSLLRTFSRLPVRNSFRALASEASSSSASHEPPKKLYGTSGRYAGAIYTSASKAGMLETVEVELKAFQKVMADRPEFSSFLENPTIPRNVKVDRVNDLLDDKISFITRNLFTTLAVNGRIGDADRVVEDFLTLMEASRGSILATITTAEPLKKKELSSIEQAIQGMVGEGKVVDLVVEEDPSLLGGLQVRVGDEFLDLSVSSRIGELRRSLLDADA